MSIVNKPIQVTSLKDIPNKYKDTPIEKLLKYHNLDFPFDKYDSAELLISMCMDNRKSIRLPDNFAYILRTGAGNLIFSEFKVSYAIAIGGVKYIVLIAHNDCGMSQLCFKKERFVEGMVNNAGWDKKHSEEVFDKYAPVFGIDDEIDFVLKEANRLSKVYPKIMLVPMYYNLEDSKLYLLE